jgi:D-apionolactonase
MSGNTLSAGPLTVLYQNGFLRYVRYGETEIVRMIYFALRDENWGTYPSIIENEKMDSYDNHFEINYDCFHERNSERIYHWKVKIAGSAAGEITFEIEGVALETILKNRAGICVLHPIKETAGMPCEIIHSDGSLLTSHFPQWIDPQNPFKNIRTMKWECDDHWYGLDFEGDEFETEDQRNWTDASFKTFCTPLDLPFPVEIKKGEKVFQRVTFKPIYNQPLILRRVSRFGDSAEIHSQENAKPKDNKFRLPEIGMGASTETDSLIPRAIELLRVLNLSHYRIEVAPFNAGWETKFAIDRNNAQLLHLPLEIALHLTENYKTESTAFIKCCQLTIVPIKKILLLSEGLNATSQELIDYAPVLKQYFPTTKIGAGTDFNFTELNRNRFDATAIDFVSYSIHPQEHAFDDLSLLENIEAQADTVSSAKKIYPAREIHISPVTLKKRFNPYTSQLSNKMLTNEQKIDPRQRENFCALWTLGSLKQLAQAGASSITFYQSYGKQGLFDDHSVFPVYSALKEVCLHRNTSMIRSESPKSREMDALVFEDGGKLSWGYADSILTLSYNDSQSG